MTYAWFDIEGRQVYRPIPTPNTKRSDLSCPTIIKDTIDPVQSMADGETYTSMSALRRTYRADGNPQGIEYTEVGTEQRTHAPAPKVTEAQTADLLDQFEAKVSRGEIS